AGRGPARGAERGAGGGGDHAPRLSERGGGARLLRGVSARLRSSWEGVSSLRHDDQEDRAGGEEHLFLPRLPEVATGAGAAVRAGRYSGAFARNSRRVLPAAFDSVSRSPSRVQREVSWSPLRYLV